jgi:hypothetical protein
MTFLQCKNCFAPLPPPGSGHSTCKFCGATTIVKGSPAARPAQAQFTRAESDPHGAKALAIDFHEQHGVDVSKDEQAMQRLGAAWTKAATELQRSPKTEVNLPFLTATNNGPLHYQRELDLKTFKLLLAKARKP